MWTAFMDLGLGPGLTEQRHLLVLVSSFVIYIFVFGYVQVQYDTVR